MIKCEVVESFSIGEETIKKYGELKNIVRAGRSQENYFYAKDKFECTEKMAQYLEKENDYTKTTKKPLIRIIEVVPEEKPKTEKKTTKKSK